MTTPSPGRRARPVLATDLAAVVGTGGSGCWTDDDSAVLEKWRDSGWVDPAVAAQALRDDIEPLFP